MAKFSIVAQRPDNSLVRLLYDNQSSEFTWADGKPIAEVQSQSWGTAAVVSRDAPGSKGAIKTLKISLGLSCNYSCTYCSQRFVPHEVDAGLREIEPFLAKLPSWFDMKGLNGRGKGLEIEFWGGEPFAYWKTLKPLAEQLRLRMPDARLLVITNGSLLTPEINEWLDRLGFHVGISHDGPGQATRGPDPFDDPERAAAIRDLYARLRPQNRISFNSMIHRDNQSRAGVQAWFVDRFGADVPIGEGSFVDPYDEGGLASMLKADEHMEYRRRAFAEVRSGGASNLMIAKQKIGDFVDSIRKGRPATALGQKCGMDRSDTVAVTLKGAVITCQNVSPVAKAPNGESHKIGTVDRLSEVRLNTSTHWSKRQECADCPVLQLCKGACMFLEGELWEKACDASYSDNLPFFAAGIEFLTGAVPIHIEGPQREDRKNIWGLVGHTRTAPVTVSIKDGRRVPVAAY
jgi:uncharacterized protein